MGGDEISKYYEGLRQATIDTLMTKFADIDENGGGVPTKQPRKAQVPQQTIETNIGGQTKAKRGAAVKKPESPKYQEESYNEPSSA